MADDGGEDSRRTNKNAAGADQAHQRREEQMQTHGTCLPADSQQQTSSPASKKKEATGHFARDHAFRTGGWYTVLTGTELAVWHIYQDASQNNGFVKLSLESVARDLGHKDTRHVRRHRARLEVHGLLEVLDPFETGWHVRMLTPPLAPILFEAKGAPTRHAAASESDEEVAAAEAARSKRTDAGEPSITDGTEAAATPTARANSAPKLGQFGTAARANSAPKGGQFGTEGGADSAPAYKEVQINVQSLIQSTAAPPSDDGAVDQSTKGGKGKNLQGRVVDTIWRPKWAAAHSGYPYPTEQRDYQIAARILGVLKQTLPEADAVRMFSDLADIALTKPEHFGWEGHPLTQFAAKLPDLISEHAHRAQGRSNARTHNSGRASNDRRASERFEPFTTPIKIREFPGYETRAG